MIKITSGRAWFFSLQENTHTNTHSNSLSSIYSSELKIHKEARMVTSTLLKLCVLGQTLRRALARQLYLKLHSPPPPCHCTAPLYFLHNTFQGGYPTFLSLVSLTKGTFGEGMGNFLSCTFSARQSSRCIVGAQKRTE